jgi:ferredoxin-NADP reductase
VLLIAGGIGITPLRALIEALPGGPGRLVLLYRASKPEDLVFRDELEQLARLRGATIHYLVGRRSELRRDPLGDASIRRLVPDVTERDVFVCGPLPMMEAVRRALLRLRVPASHIHAERFAY